MSMIVLLGIMKMRTDTEELHSDLMNLTAWKWSGRKPSQYVNVKWCKCWYSGWLSQLHAQDNELWADYDPWGVRSGELSALSSLKTSAQYHSKKQCKC